MDDTNDSLLDFVSNVSGDAYLKVEESLGDGFVRLKISEAERRQAKHDIRAVEDIVVELLRNSRDAHARRIFLASTREGDIRSLTIVDDGVGIPPHLHDRVFEPRVTSKLETMVMDRWGVHGRGMALYSVRQNVSSAVVMASDQHKGTSLAVSTDVHSLSERADQSTWPVVERAEDGSLHVAKGPHNIVRRTIEFACEHPEIEVYLGSPAEVLATMHMLVTFSDVATDLLFCDDLDKVPVWQRPAAASDAAELVEVAGSIGLAISERTAHRILSGELAPLENVITLAFADDEEAAEPDAPDIYKDRRGLRLHHNDISAFKRELEKAFDAISERYYLQLRGEPKVTVGKNEIRVRFEVEKED